MIYYQDLVVNIQKATNVLEKDVTINQIVKQKTEGSNYIKGWQLNPFICLWLFQSLLKGEQPCIVEVLPMI